MEGRLWGIGEEKIWAMLFEGICNTFYCPLRPIRNLLIKKDFGEIQTNEECI